MQYQLCQLERFVFCQKIERISFTCLCEPLCLGVFVQKSHLKTSRMLNAARREQDRNFREVDATWTKVHKE